MTPWPKFLLLMLISILASFALDAVSPVDYHAALAGCYGLLWSWYYWEAMDERRMRRQRIADDLERIA